jgi:hypothetical protein
VTEHMVVGDRVLLDATFGAARARLRSLAGICLDDLADTDACAHVTLQWEPIAAGGTLFTALEADLMLVPAGHQITALALSGAYRPQPGRAGAGLDPAVVRECAAAAVDLGPCASSWRVGADPVRGCPRDLRRALSSTPRQLERAIPG